jgi:DNA processing protein
VAELGPVTVLKELSGRGAHGELADGLARRLESADPITDLAVAERLGARFVTPEDDEWPDALTDLGHVGALHERGGVPVGLWVRGSARLDESLADAVAVVGSRSATTAGTTTAGEIAAGLAEQGHPVVSGAAFGIDQAAHRGALAARGRTVAVLACGVDRAYPVAHTRLLEAIAGGGLVISEAAPGCAPTRIRFLARNRLIAALTRGTVVVEAALRSGALNTAHWAASLSRPLMGVPGPVTSAQSAGVHRMIRARDAALVTCAADVLELVGGSGSHLVAAESAPVSPRDRLDLEQRVVLDAVPVRRGSTVSAIGRVAGVSGSRAGEALLVLAKAGMVERNGDLWRKTQDREELV